MWDLSSRVRVEPEPPALEAQGLNHCTSLNLKQHRVQEIFRGTYEDFEAQWHELIPLQDFEA